jgi:HTH-type transcriptional regulator/antitoxin HigA
MEIRPIRSEADYDAALVDIEQYFDREPTPGTPEADRFDVLATLIGAYEDKHHAIAAPDAVTAIAEVMALRGHKQADLGRLLGSKSRASEIMNRKRRLTLEQAKKLHGAWGVPAASLLGDVGDLDAVGTQQKTRDARASPPRLDRRRGAGTSTQSSWLPVC